MIQHTNITLYGKVQGVFMRRTIKQEARRLGVFGFVRNDPDGTVYIEAEADEPVLEQFILWLKTGGGGGLHEIQTADVSEGEFKAFDRFEIK